MKTNRILLTLALLAGAVSVAARANDRPYIEASIPFNFTVGHHNYPAGHYILSVSDDQHVVTLRSLDGRIVAFTNANQAHKITPADRSKLIFQRAGNSYYLSQIWAEGSDLGQELRAPERTVEAPVMASKSNPSAGESSPSMP